MLTYLNNTRREILLNRKQSTKQEYMKGSIPAEREILLLFTALLYALKFYFDFGASSIAFASTAQLCFVALLVALVQPSSALPG